MVNPTTVYIVKNSWLSALPHDFEPFEPGQYFSGCYSHTKLYRNLNEVGCNFYTPVKEDSLEIYDAVFLVMIYGSTYFDKGAECGNPMRYHSL